MRREVLLNSLHVRIADAHRSHDITNGKKSRRKKVFTRPIGLAAGKASTIVAHVVTAIVHATKLRRLCPNVVMSERMSKLEAS